MGGDRTRAASPGLDARQGRPASGALPRDIVDGIRYLVKEGIQWRAMPADFPHWRTVYDYTDGWQKTGATEAMYDELRRQCGSPPGASPSDGWSSTLSQ